MASVPEFLDLAAELYEKSERGGVLVTEARRLIGGPFSDKQIEAITGVSRRLFRNQYKDQERPGGRLNPSTLKDVALLRYQADIGAALDKGALWRVILSGTSPRVLARLTGKRPGEIDKLMEGDIDG